jgi:hypothetical protein
MGSTWSTIAFVMRASGQLCTGQLVVGNSALCKAPPYVSHLLPPVSRFSLHWLSLISGNG